MINIYYRKIPRSIILIGYLLTSFLLFSVCSSSVKVVERRSTSDISTEVTEIYLPDYADINDDATNINDLDAGIDVYDIVELEDGYLDTNYDLVEFEDAKSDDTEIKCTRKINKPKGEEQMGL
jgi:hypothetical protein